MFIFKRYPLTAPTIALFSAYTVACVVVKRIRKFYYSRRTRSTDAHLILDLQYYIIDLLMREETDQDLLPNLTLVCKDWCKHIDNNPIWFKERFHYFLAKQHSDGLDEQTLDQIQKEDGEFIQRLGSHKLFSAKITYFLYKRRISETINFGSSHQDPGSFHKKRYVAFEENVKSESLYVPWLNQSIISNPEVVWKFFWTAFWHPSWIFKFTQIYRYRVQNERYDRITEDTHNINIITRILRVLSVPLATFATIDNIIHYSLPMINDIRRSSEIFPAIWSPPESWSMLAQIHTLFTLAWYRPFYQPTPSILKLLKYASLFSIVIFSKGFSTLATAVRWSMIGLLMGIFRFSGYKKEWYIIVVAIVFLAPFLYNYPVMVPLSLGLVLIGLLDMKGIKPQKQPQMHLSIVLHSLMLIAPLVFHAIQNVLN